MSNLVKRTIFGALYAALILAALLLGSSSLYLAVFGVLVFLANWEFSNLVSTHRIYPLRRITDAVAAVYLFWTTQCIATEGLGATIYLLPYAAFLLYSLVRSLYSERELMPGDLAKVIFGQIYTGGFLSIAHLLHGSQMSSGYSLLFLAFIAIWVNDSGAYLAGSQLGRHKLFPSLSPNKSWEGFVGGFIATVLVSYFLMEGSLLGLVYGAVISVAATWGDLFESMLKRKAGVKDSGKVIPGHGGILDRIDSLLFVLPFLAFVEWIIYVYQHLHLS